MVFKFVIASLLGTLFFQAELEKRSLLDDKIEILVPKAWKQMSEEHIKIKYPGARPPKYVLSDVTGGISLAFNHTDTRATQEQIEAYKNVLKSSLTNAFPEAEWIKDSVTVINGRKVGFCKVITNAQSGRIYNQMFF